VRVLSTCLAGARWLFWLLASAALAADILTKRFLWHPPDEGRSPVVLVPGLLRLVGHPGNRGGAMGLPGPVVLYTVAAVVGLALIVYLLVTTDPRRALVHGGLGLLAGGAVGNLIDRLWLGSVRDFIDLHWGDAYHWPTFNVADAVICVGFALIAWDCLTGRRRPDCPVKPTEEPQAC
jgi:signal peptidase II